MSKLTNAQQNFIDKLLKSFEKGQLPWRPTWDQTLTKAYNAKSLKPYTGINQLNLFITSLNCNYDDPRWMTFKQANEAGYRIMKGAVGTDIFYYAFRDMKTNEIITSEEYKKLEEDDRKNIAIVAKSYKVYNAAQINGIPSIDINKESIKFDNEKAAVFAETLQSNMDIEILHSGNKAFYDPKSDRIVLPPVNSFMDEQAYYGVRLHESAHATMHPDRLNRDAHGGKGSEKYAIEELRAELTSAFMTLDIGFHFDQMHEDNHIAYIQSWQKVLKEQPQYIFSAISDAQKIRNYMLEKGEYEKVYALQDKQETVLGNDNLFRMDPEEYPLNLRTLLQEESAIDLYQLGVPICVECGYLDKEMNYYTNQQIDEIVSEMSIDEENVYYEKEGLCSAGHLIKSEEDFSILSDPYAHAYIDPHNITFDQMSEFLNTFECLTDNVYKAFDEEQCKKIKSEMLENVPITYEKMMNFRDKYLTTEIIKNMAQDENWIAASKRENEETVSYINKQLGLSDQIQTMGKESIIINLFGGPGAGKTTCAWEIASKLKKMGYVTEYVPEYAKELVWDEKYEFLDGSLEHQQMLLKEQEHRVGRLIGKVDFIVTDAPSLLNLNYLKSENMDEISQYKENVLQTFNKYNNFNLLIKRGDAYETEGRIHTLEEALILDESIKEILEDNNLYYGSYDHENIDRAIENSVKTYERINNKISKKYEQAEQVTLEDMKNSISISDYAQTVLGMSLVKESRGIFRLDEHDSCKIYPNNTFYRFSAGVGGSIIDFIKHFEGIDTKEAIHRMSKYYKQYHPERIYDVNAAKHLNSEDRFKANVEGIEVPEKANTNKHVYAYLTKTRGIKPSIVNEYINQRILYEDTHHNCVFLGRYDKKVFYANLRGTGSKPFKQDVPGSIKEVGVYINNGSDTLVVNEAVIDQMSYMSMTENPKAFNYLSVCSAANTVNAIRFHMNKRQEALDVKRIIIGLDNDEAGEKNAQKAIDFLKENYPEIEAMVHIPDAKDFNEQLQNEMNLLAQTAPSSQMELNVE